MKGMIQCIEKRIEVDQLCRVINDTVERVADTSERARYKGVFSDE